MVWHADFIDTYLRPPLETWCSSRVARGLVEPLWTLVRAEAARCDAVFVATRSQQEKLENHGLTNVVRNRFGVAKEYFRPEARDEQLRAHFSGGDPTQKILVAIGRMAVEKHWDVIFDAYEEIARTENVALVVLGDGPEKAQIERRAAALKNVFVRGFEGDRKKLAAILASSDLLLHGCPYETFGLGVAEALACGVSAALPAAGGTLEFQGPGSVVHYPALSAPAAAEAARSLLRQDPRELRSRAVENVTRIRSEREHFAEQLSWYAALKEDRFAAHSSRP
jgi:alpha-1,6-mannosyltransferase